MKLTDTYLVEAESEAGAVMATLMELKGKDADEYIEKYLTLSDRDIGVVRIPTNKPENFLVVYYIPTEVGVIENKHLWAVQIFKEFERNVD